MTTIASAFDSILSMVKSAAKTAFYTIVIIAGVCLVLTFGLIISLFQALS